MLLPLTRLILVLLLESWVNFSRVTGWNELPKTQWTRLARRPIRKAFCDGQSPTKQHFDLSSFVLFRI